AAANLEFEEAARMRDEIKRLEATELLLAEDPMARQAEVESEAGKFSGRRKYGGGANLPGGDAPLPPTRARKPGDEDMGPPNFGGGDARPLARGAPRPRARSMAGKPGSRTFKGKPH
ncbi:MAG: UvrB/UvrC motif-containing protein, partial [Rhodoblastus sp.]